MPHLVVEHTSNLHDLQAKELLYSLNHALVETGQIKPNELKSRISSTSQFLIGLGDLKHGFIHVHIYLLAGRSEDQKKQIADAAIQALEEFRAYQAHKLNVQLSVQLTDMPSLDYRKVIVEYH